MLPKYVLFFLLSAFFYSCNRYEAFEPITSSKTVGYVPDEFISKNQALIVRIERSKTVKNVSKIQLVKDYLFISERKKGIHVIDNKNPTLPKNLFFISIPAMTDFIFQDSVIIATNANDLIAINSSIIDKIASNEFLIEDVLKTSPFLQVGNRLERVINYPNYPDVRNTYFQCSDSLGYVLSWKIDSTQKSISCYR